MVRISNGEIENADIAVNITLHLEDVWVSEAYADELLGRSDLEVVDGPSPMRFDDAGNLEPVSVEKLIKS